MALTLVKRSGDPKALLEKLFEIRDTAHKAHLRQRDKKLSTHLALEKLYNGILELADTMTESYFGLYGPLELDWKTVPIPNPESYVADCYSVIDKNRGCFSESFLQNQVDEVQQLLAQTLYRLRYVQS